MIPGPSDEGYRFPLKAGSGTYLSVKIYNDDMWDNIMGQDINPNDIFGGEADKVNSTCKYIIKSWVNNTLDIFDIVEILVGKTYDEIEKINYRDTFDLKGEWDVWMVTKDLWDYTTDNLTTNPDKEAEKFPIFIDPEDFSDILKEFENLNDAYNAKLFVYQMVMKGIPIGCPINKYLETMVNELDSNDIELLINEQTDDVLGLIISDRKVEPYYIKAFYDDDGMLFKLTFEDENFNVFYQQSIPLYLIFGYETSFLLIFSIISILGIIYIIYKKKK